MAGSDFREQLGLLRLPLGGSRRLILALQYIRVEGLNQGGKKGAPFLAPQGAGPGPGQKNLPGSPGEPHVKKAIFLFRKKLQMIQLLYLYFPN